VRTYVVSLDAAQYQLDVNATASGDAPDVYPALNVVMRRDAKENNFKVRLHIYTRVYCYKYCMHEQRQRCCACTAHLGGLRYFFAGAAEAR
jgi:hypothetical protein